MRAISALLSNPARLLSSRIYRNAATKEYVVRFYREGRHLKDADYYTEDKADAHATALAGIGYKPPRPLR